MPKSDQLHKPTKRNPTNITVRNARASFKRDGRLLRRLLRAEAFLAVAFPADWKQWKRAHPIKD